MLLSGHTLRARSDRTKKVLREKLNYIHHNPVRSGLVLNAEDWQWSSARDYNTDTNGAIPVWKEWA